MLVDERINFTFAETDLDKFKGLLYDQICELAGGPCKYTGRDMIESHKKLNTTNEQFNALAEDLYKAFDSSRRAVPAAEPRDGAARADATASGRQGAHREMTGL